MRARFVPRIVFALTLASATVSAQVVPPPWKQPETLCGSSAVYQEVEQYDGTLGVRPLSRAFVNRHQSPVGRLRWNNNLASIYTNPGNVNGNPACTGTLISQNLFLTAGHCFDIDGGGWTTPRNNTTGRPVPPTEIATNMHVEFNYQLDPAGIPRPVTSFGVTSLREYRLGGKDYAVIELAGTPGSSFGVARIAATELVPGDELTIIQHPKGLRKKIESGSFAGYLSGRITYGDIDTEGGTSGAGVLDWRGRLVGVHVLAGCSPTGGANKAVDIIDIAVASTVVADLVREHGQYNDAVTTGDFNGDGQDDIAVGDPGATVSGARAAGRVRVVYSNASGPITVASQYWHQNSTGVEGVAEAGDFFGTSVAAGDFDDDGYDDLAIGVSGEAVGSTKRAGAVNVLFGSSQGLTSAGDQILYQNTAGVPGVSEERDVFGSGLAVGDFNDDGSSDLAVGVPGESVGKTSNAGAFHVFYGAAAGLSAGQIWDQDSTSIVGESEAGDRLGESLGAGDFNFDGFDDLAVGAPGEAVGSVSDAGAVNVLYGSASGISATGNQIWHQDSTGIVGVAELGDRFGASVTAGKFNADDFDDLAVGVPGESIGTLNSAGFINVLYGSGARLRDVGNSGISQDTAGVPDASEAEDRFGISLASGYFSADLREDVVVGVEGEAIVTPFFSLIYEAGAINVLLGGKSQLTGTGAQIFHQNSVGVPDLSERADRMGSSVAAGQLNPGTLFDVVVGVPGEDWGTTPMPETVMTFFGSALGLTGAGSLLF